MHFNIQCEYQQLYAIKQLSTNNKSLLAALLSPKLQSYENLPDSSNNINIGPYNYPNQYF